MTPKFAYDQPDTALAAWRSRLSVVGGDDGQVDEILGRVLSADALADRDSPAADVSAMDGYAVRLGDVPTSSTFVRGECAAGSPQRSMPADGILKIFTGGLVPAGADAVVRVEDATLDGDHVQFSDGLAVAAGAHIRRRGENVSGGSVIVDAGTCVDAAAMATLANFGRLDTPVHRRVRVTVLTTGGEVLGPRETPGPHQLRNSNAAAIVSALRGRPWIDCQTPLHASDDPDELCRVLTNALEQSDAVITTGGVSMGDHDYVPRCVRRCGGEIVFHRLPIRPGKPILAAVTTDGKMIAGLPGNPVSAVVNTYRMAIPMLRSMAGMTRWMPSSPAVELDTPLVRSMPLHRMQLVRINDDGRASPVAGKGSGDLVSLGRSDGFVEIPAGDGDGPNVVGPFRYWSW